MTVIDQRWPGTELSAAVSHLPHRDTTGFPLRRLLEGERHGCFDVVAAPEGLDVLVSGVRIWDPQRPPAAGDLVLVPAARTSPLQLTEVLAVAAREAAAAVVVRLDRTGAVAVRAAAARAGVPVLSLTAAVSWDEAGAFARALVPTTRPGVSSGAGGLFDLADGAAAALDRPVLVGDADGRLLAWSAPGGSPDAATIAAVLTRRLPPAITALRTVRAVGTVRAGPSPGGAPVLVAPVLARGALAGYVCAGGPAPATTHDEGALADVAACAAAHFLTAPVDDEDALRAELLRGVLDGAGSLEALTGRSDDAGPVAWRLVGLTGVGIGTAPETVLARTARMLCPGATAAVVVGGHGAGGKDGGEPGAAAVVVLLPERSGPAPLEQADRLRVRCAAVTGHPVVACVGDPVPPDGDLPAAHRALQRGLTVLAARPDLSAADAVSTLAALRPHTVIAELAVLARQHDALLQGPLDALRHDPTPRGGEHLDTLAAWFDAGGDLTRAATRLRLHRNTLRYRLQRIEQLCGVDLTDPVQRFTCELQVRLLGLQPGH